MKFLIKFLKFSIAFILFLLVIGYFGLKSLVLLPPDVNDKTVMQLPLEKYNDSLTFCGDSWLHTNSGGISELYITGSPFDMGVKNGKLSHETAGRQEQYFFDFINNMVPSSAMLEYLRYFIAYFNKDLDKYISLELRQEIYGVSLYASDKFDFVGDKYHRILNYHAAHDIGHTIQNMNLVNCTAFSMQNERTLDSTLLIGRNLDFSAGDDFAREKLVVFCKPDSGYKFAYISWGGMIGVLSGMNEHGLSITLNSAKSGIPGSAKTPVSLVSREVLQHAKTISEAYDIISNHETFVSESFFIGSAIDNSTAVIEKSLDKTAIYTSGESKLVLTNHFQSGELKGSPLNLEAIEEGCTMYRLNRTHELIDAAPQADVDAIADILRDKNGMGDSPIGIGNESALNQLICHHSVIFNPAERLMWVSKFPYQENDYVAYDLNTIFADSFDPKHKQFTVDSLSVEATNFYKTKGVEQIWKHRADLDSIKSKINKEVDFQLKPEVIQELVKGNPEFYYTHFVLGLYYKFKGRYDDSSDAVNKALSCQIPRKVDEEKIQEELKLLHEN